LATNFYFNNFQSSQEQLLIENLVVESIKIYGHDLFYLPRTRVNFDNIYGEDPVSEFRIVYPIEMYIKNVDGFKGDGDFLSKFNLEIRDQVTFTVARRVFNEEVGSLEAIVRPREGDLIYFPLNNKIFEIKFVEHEAIFYQLGALQTFDITCELFEYSNERFITGYSDIDNLYDNFTIDVVAFGLKYETTGGYSDFLLDEDGFQLVTEGASIGTNVIDDISEIQNEASDFVDFSEKDPFSEGAY
jgi:hypothetical protein